MVSKTIDAIVAGLFVAGASVIAKAAGSDEPMTLQYAANLALVGGTLGATAVVGVYAAKALIQNFADYINKK